MPVPRSRARPRPRWRRVLAWLLLPPLLLVGLPLLVFVVWNRIDEPVGAAASRFGAQWRGTVPDGENAWMLLAGLDAPVDADPIAWARARVDAFNDRVVAAPRHSAQLEPAALPEDANPKITATSERHGFVALCEARQADCPAWFAQHRDGLQRLREDNALRLARYATATRLPRWRTAYLPTQDTPLVDAWVSTLHARVLASALSPDTDATATATALDALGAEVAFWQRVRAQPQDLFALLLAARRIEDVYWLVGGWIEHAPRAALVAQTDALDRILAPRTARTDWAPPLAYELQVLDHTLRTNVPGPFVSLRDCATGSTPKGGCGTWVLSQFAYLHQATLNQAARAFEQIERVLEAEPRDLAEIEREAGVAIEAEFVRFDDAGALLEQMSYNYSGRILANLAIPAFDWGKREQDLESLRRMVLLARDARLADVAPDGMAAFAAAQPESLHDPVTARPFAWDRERRTFWFTPLAGKPWPSGRVSFATAARVADAAVSNADTSGEQTESEGAAQ